MSHSERTSTTQRSAVDASAVRQPGGLHAVAAESKSDDSGLAEAVPQWRWRTSLRIFLLLIVGLLLMIGGGYWLLRQEPVFYEAALSIPSDQAYQNSQALEIAVCYWRNDLVEADAWVAELSQDQINGWLASDLTRKFTSFMPQGFENPRVQIDPQRLSVAFRTVVQGIPTVMVATVEIFPTSPSNRIGVRIHSVHAGRLPIPVSVFTQPTIDMLKRQKIDVQWYNGSDGDPVALLTIPKKLLAIDGQHVILDRLEIAEDSIRFAGRAEPLQPAVAVEDGD